MKKSEEEAQPMAGKAPEPKPETPPVSEWERLAELWADKSNIGPLAQRLHNELAGVGITSLEMVASSPIKVLAVAARAALYADAQSLQAAAAKLIGGKS